MELPTEVEDLLRAEAPHVLGALTRRFDRFEVAEDAVQEALLVASRRWPVEGVPAEPRSWLIRVAYRRMVDLLRADGARRRRELAVGAAEAAELGPQRGAPVPSTDDSLTLLLLCCHPDLTPASRIALTLRAVGGLTTAEIAHAYGTSERTMATRISRAKARLREGGARFSAPQPAEETARLTGVMHVLYLVYNEGYVATQGGNLGRVDLAREAIRLTRLLHELRPGHAEVTGLLALMLLTEARRDARTGNDGRLVPWEEQDRSRWDRTLADEGRTLLDGVWGQAEAGPYQVQAAIAAVHARAPDATRTDWPQIAGLYLWLERLQPTNPVRLSRVVAVAEAFGAERGLALLAESSDQHGMADDPLVRQRLLAVRAHLRERVGDGDGAVADYRGAAELAGNEPERSYLLRRASAIS